jgi:prephenate dehydrogenase
LSPHSLEQVERISEQMQALIGMIKSRDKEQLNAFFQGLRANIGLKP